ncbi:MAG TPA: transglutaminase-like cysteine peptidase, partial [Bacteroidales bacterium]|nr:transglutaminase-like cysteine peptidase [Bacteroidales bacterium]
MKEAVHNIRTLALLLMVLSGTLHLQAQVFPIGMFNGQTITTCSGTFYDAGGNYAGYTFNEDYSITFCSSDPLNTHIKLYFTTFNVQAGDTLWIFDGPTIASPLLGTFHTGNNPSLQFFMATMANSSGCLTARFVSDAELYGVADYWATPTEFIARGAGDCEDFAIAKYATLKAMGMDVAKLRITYVKSLTLDQAHMVLAYYPTPDAEPLILDNLNRLIKSAGQ